jgi:hypothetical protein
VSRSHSREVVHRTILISTENLACFFCVMYFWISTESAGAAYINERRQKQSQFKPKSLKRNCNWSSSLAVEAAMKIGTWIPERWIMQEQREWRAVEHLTLNKKAKDKFNYVINMCDRSLFTFFRSLLNKELFARHESMLYVYAQFRLNKKTC